jgi:hypothetical protein
MNRGSGGERRGAHPRPIFCVCWGSGVYGCGRQQRGDQQSVAALIAGGALVQQGKTAHWRLRWLVEKVCERRELNGEEQDSGSAATWLWRAVERPRNADLVLLGLRKRGGENEEARRPCSVTQGKSTRPRGQLDRSMHGWTRVSTADAARGPRPVAPPP